MKRGEDRRKDRSSGSVRGMGRGRYRGIGMTTVNQFQCGKRIKCFCCCILLLLQRLLPLGYLILYINLLFTSPPLSPASAPTFPAPAIPPPSPAKSLCPLPPPFAAPPLSPVLPPYFATSPASSPDPHPPSSPAHSPSSSYFSCSLSRAVQAFSLLSTGAGPKTG